MMTSSGRSRRTCRIWRRPARRSRRAATWSATVTVRPSHPPRRWRRRDGPHPSRRPQPPLLRRRRRGGQAAVRPPDLGPLPGRWARDRAVSPRRDDGRDEGLLRPPARREAEVHQPGRRQERVQDRGVRRRHGPVGDPGPGLVRPVLPRRGPGVPPPPRPLADAATLLPGRPAPVLRAVQGARRRRAPGGRQGSRAPRRGAPGRHAGREGRDLRAAQLLPPMPAPRPRAGVQAPLRRRRAHRPPRRNRRAPGAPRRRVVRRARGARRAGGEPRGHGGGGEQRGAEEPGAQGGGERGEGAGVGGGVLHGGPGEGGGAGAGAGERGEAEAVREDQEDRRLHQGAAGELGARGAGHRQGEGLIEQLWSKGSLHACAVGLVDVHTTYVTHGRNMHTAFRSLLL